MPTGADDLYIADTGETIYAGKFRPVIPENSAPEWASGMPDEFTLVQGRTLDIRSYASDPDNDPLTYALESGTLPTGVTFSNGVFTASESATTGLSGDLVISADDGFVDEDEQEPGVGITNFTLESASSGTFPFTIGLGFGKGEAFSIQTDLDNYQVVVKRHWSDGTIKHAIVSGRATLVADTPLTVTVETGTPQTGTALTAADIAAAEPTASVQCGTIGTVSLADLLATPFRTWISGHEMVECHYRGDVGGGTLLYVWFHVRLYADGRMWIRTCTENGYLDNGAGAISTRTTQAYDPVVTIGGVEIYTRPSVSITNITQEQHPSRPNDYRQTITAPGHGYRGFMAPRTDGIVGMVELNGLNIKIASVPDEDTYITDWRSTGPLSEYVSGGTVQFSHHRSTSWMAEGWIGGDPSVTFLHNVAHLRSTKLVPNYGWDEPSESTLDDLHQTYAPMECGSYSGDMGGVGYHAQIGLLPKWEALYCTSGDVRALRATLAHGHALRSHGIVWRSFATKRAATPSEFPTWSLNGHNKGGESNVGAGAYVWERAHFPSGGYLAYLLTGDFSYYETLELQSSVIYFCISTQHGSGLNRLCRTQIRGIGWTTRSVAQHVALAPDGDEVAADYRAWLGNVITHYCNQGPYNASASQLGYPIALSNYTPGNGLAQAPWQFHFWMMSNGHAWDIEPGFADTTDHKALRDFMYKGIVGLLGANGVDNYCYTHASRYYIWVGETQTGSLTTSDNFFSTWGQVYERTFGSENTSCGTTLVGDSAGSPGSGVTGYWGNLMPAIAFAVDHDAPGAAESWARMTGADNWSVVANTGFDNIPTWGIVPR